MDEKAKTIGPVISQRKITAPPLPHTMVHRQALVQRLTEILLNAPHYKLVLLKAPAGHGKTTLLAEFARQERLPCCWVFLERGEAEPIPFLRLLLASLRQCFPQFGAQVLPLLSDTSVVGADHAYPQMVLKELITAMTHEIPERFAILLCHYQEVNANPLITDIVEYLLQHLPEQCTILLESREVPELDFASLLARRSLFGIGRDLLRFTPQEIIELAHVQGSRKLRQEEAEQLATAFDGWITGLLLGTRLGDVQFLQQSWSGPASEKGPRIQTRDQTLFSYMAREVFEHHQEIYAFLKEAVVLLEMTPRLCSDLLGLSASEAQRRLQYLEYHGLFVTQSGESLSPSYTCHPVLRDLLYKELQRQNPERFAELHLRASELLSAQRCYEEAIFHALEARAEESAARLITAFTDQLLGQGHPEMLQQWIDSLSEKTLLLYPHLLLIRANIALRRSELDIASPLLEKLSEQLSSPLPTLANPAELPRLRAELTITRANILKQQGHYRQAQQFCEEVLASLPTDEVSLRAHVYLSLGGCAQFRGDLHTAIGYYQKALQLWGRHTVYCLTARAHSSLAAAYRLLGNFTLAEHHSSCARACWKQLQDTRGTINSLIDQACIIRDQGSFTEAEALLQEALKKTRGLRRLHRLQGYILVNLGELSQDQGCYDRSLELTEEGLALARHLGDTYLLNYALLTLGMTYLSIGDTATASLLLSEMRVEITADTPILSEQQVQRDLARGTIWLKERRYSEALEILHRVESALRTMEIKREQLKVLVRLAACYLAQDQWSKARDYLKSVENMLVACEAYKQRVHSELRAFPLLQRAIEQSPDSAALRALLHWETEADRCATIGEVPLALSALPGSGQAILSAAPRLKLFALGEPLVQLDGQPITRWRMARAMEICFYLLECGRPMRKEQIITALWEEADEQVTRTFYSTIHYLRKALGGETAIRLSKGGVYSLDLVSIYGVRGVWYDVAEFEEHALLGKKALAEHADDIAREAFLTVVELYRGDYLPSFYSDWCNGRRDKLRRLYLDARQQLAQIAWRSADDEEGAEHWRQMLAIDACLEEAHYGLMRCYIRQGKRGLALRQYQRCTETLQQELDAIPGPTIQNLYRLLMRQSGA